jgi:hypothetical protein
MSLDKAKIWGEITSACGVSADCESCSVELSLKPSDTLEMALFTWLYDNIPSFDIEPVIARRRVVREENPLEVAQEKAYREAREGAREEVVKAQSPYQFYGVEPYSATYGIAAFIISLEDVLPFCNEDIAYLLRCATLHVKECVPYKFRARHNGMDKTEEWSFSQGTRDDSLDTYWELVQLTFNRI